jgi:hypothetical protein
MLSSFTETDISQSRIWSAVTPGLSFIQQLRTVDRRSRTCPA